MTADENYISELAKRTKKAAQSFYGAPLKTRNLFLSHLAELLAANQEEILELNQKDLERAQENELASSLVDRLRLSPERIGGLIKSVEEIALLPDPLGEIVDGKVLESGITLYQKRVPLGVVLVIYESRPNVTIDIATLCIKSGNGVILRGGKESTSTNKALIKVIRKALEKAGIDQDLVGFVEKTDRELIDILVRQNDSIDIVVPRGGYALISRVSEKSTIPVIKHDAGLCHIFLDQDYDLEKAIRIILNAKVARPGVCNAVETLLIHQDFKHTKEVLAALAEKQVELRLDDFFYEKFPGYHLAKEEDWSTEYLELILSVKSVGSTAEAVKWINDHSSSHSEAILSSRLDSINFFKENVDSACVLVNCSTRFHDGGVFGLGAEVGISTGKLHVRGPMGMRHLTCLKYIAEGEGQVRE